MDLILYNPKSKNSKANIQTHKLIKKYKLEKKPFRLKSILKIHDTKKYLEENKQFEKIILLGGDGTINKLVNKVHDYDIEQDIYLKRNGSGNDFLRSLKDHDTNPQYIMENTLNNSAKHYFINGTGFGLDGLIIDYVDKAKKKGKLRYTIASLQAIVKYVPETLEAVIDGEKMTFERTYMVTINNGRYIGGGMEISPKAKLDDELLDVIIVHGINKLVLLLLFITIYLVQHTKFKKWIFNKKCKTIDVKFPNPQFSQSDGELTDGITSMSVKSSGKQIHLRAYKKRS